MTVNGRDYSIPSAVSIALNRKGGHGRYSGWLTAAVIEDRYEGWRRLLILQRVDPYLKEKAYWKTRLTAFHFRLLTIGEDCAVTSEAFDFPQRRHPLYRAYLVREIVALIGIGLYKELEVWPSYLMLVYPVGTFVLGLVVAGFGAARLRKQRRITS